MKLSKIYKKEIIILLSIIILLMTFYCATATLYTEYTNAILNNPSGTQTQRRGMMIITSSMWLSNVTFQSLTINITACPSATDWYIFSDSGTNFPNVQLAHSTLTGNTVSFNYIFSANTKYWILFDASGGGWQCAYDYTPYTPVNNTFIATTAEDYYNSGNHHDALFSGIEAFNIDVANIHVSKPIQIQPCYNENFSLNKTPQNKDFKWINDESSSINYQYLEIYKFNDAISGYIYQIELFNNTNITTLAMSDNTANEGVTFTNGSYYWNITQFYNSTIENTSDLCTFNICVSQWEQLTQPCNNGTRLILYEDINNCLINNGYPSLEGTYESCLLPISYNYNKNELSIDFNTTLFITFIVLEIMCLILYGIIEKYVKWLFMALAGLIMIFYATFILSNRTIYTIVPVLMYIISFILIFIAVITFNNED